MNGPKVLAPVLAGLALIASGCGASASSTAAAQAPEVAVTPAQVQLAPSGRATFDAVVTGLVNTGVTWSVVEAGGGTVDATGAYVAPATAGSYHVVATSVADPTLKGVGQVDVGTVQQTSLIPADRQTVWNPGIPGGVPVRNSVCATIDAATYGNGTTDAAAAIQAAVNACPKDGVVYLPPGTYLLSTMITLTKPVVLRGAGAGSTTLQKSGGSVAVMIGNWTNLGAPIALTADAPKGSTSLTVADASAISVGDMLHLDQVDDPAVVMGTVCPYLKRGSTGAWRSIGQMVEVAGKSGNVLTLTSPLHWTFTTALSAQVVTLSPKATKWAGLEDLRITGASTVAVNVQYAAYSWIKGVETDHVDGVHVSLAGTYRFILRDSYAHHSVNYTYGGASYGYSLEWQSSDDLIENNIVYYMNKPIQFRASGGGNVVAYNYVDDEWAIPGWQEVGIDSHCSFSHMELVEGNYAPHAGVASTWGNAGNITYFRNNFSTVSLTRPGDYQNVEALELDANMVGFNVLGNVLGSPGRTISGAAQQFEALDRTSCMLNVPYMFRTNYDSGNGGYCSYTTPPNTITSSELLRHGNFDYVNNSVVWDPTITDHALPASLYLIGKPAFFGSSAWPWVDPTAATPTQTLPAKQRFDAGTPNG